MRYWFYALLILGLSVPVFASDWIKLHEQADRLTPTQVEAGALKNSAESRYILGLIYLNSRKDGRAREVFEQILQDNPSMYEAKWGVAECMRRQHQLDDAKVLLLEVLKQDANFSPAQISLGYIEYIKLNFNAAARYGYLVIDRGRRGSDLSNYVRACCLYAGAKGMIAHYGGVLSKAINGTVVLPTLKKAEALQPDSPGVLFGLGSFYLLAPVLAGGDIDKAEQYLKKGIAEDPGFSDIYVRLAQLYLVKGDKDKYTFYLDKALEIDPGNEIAQDIKSGNCKFICIKE